MKSKKKVIRLTESDLERLVQKIINEESGGIDYCKGVTKSTYVKEADKMAVARCCLQKAGVDLSKIGQVTNISQALTLASSAGFTYLDCYNNYTQGCIRK